MGEIIKSLRSFDLKFRHITAKVIVGKKSDGYIAFIRFPNAYMVPGFNEFYTDGIIASSEEKAADVAAFIFKKRYFPLDVHIRQIGTFNFFVQRIRFRTFIEKQVGEHKYSFAVTQHSYGISENVDGLKFSKGLFDRKESLSTKSILFFINYENVFYPLHLLGFNSKFLGRLMHRYNAVKEYRLKIFDDGRMVDEIAANPDRVKNHVIDYWPEFAEDMLLERQIRKSHKVL